MSQVWFITGSSRGLGRSLVEAALAAGHKVIATARNVGLLSDIAHEYPDDLVPLELDVRDVDRIGEVLRIGLHTFGNIDVVVNNAATVNMESIEDVQFDEFRSQVETVFFGTVNVTKAAIPLFRLQRSGHFIQIASICTRRVCPGLSAYQSAKWAVKGFSEVLAREMQPFNVKVTIVEPAGLRTEMASEIRGSFRDEYDSTVGRESRRFLERSGSEPIDPAKAAEALIKITQEEHPPLSLVLGADAVDLVEGLNQQQAAEDKKWANIGRPVDFPLGPPHDVMPHVKLLAK